LNRLKELDAELRAAGNSPARSRPAAAVAMAAEPASQFGEVSEAEALKAWLDLSDQESALKRRLKDAEAALDANAMAQYAKLAESEVKNLIVEDKWLAAISSSTHGEMERISEGLTQRLKQLVDRYESTAPALARSVAQLEADVSRHLAGMGFSWE